MHYFDQPKFQVLCCGGPNIANASKQDLIGQLQRKLLVCDNCVDSFTQRWLNRLSDASGSVRARAMSALDMQVASTPVSSVRVEKKHLLGQETRKARTRGPAPSAEELGKRSYERSVTQAHDKKTKLVEKAVLGRTARKSFGQLVIAASVQRRHVRNADVAARAMMTSKKAAHAVSAWNMYLSLHWNPTISPSSEAAEIQRLQVQWGRATAAEKASIQALADKQTELMHIIKGMTLEELRASGLHVGHLGKVEGSGEHDSCYAEALSMALPCWHRFFLERAQAGCS